MMVKTHAIYERGVFRPTERVDLPERCEVELEATFQKPGVSKELAMAELVEILSRSYPGGPPDLAERHNEHQP